MSVANRLIGLIIPPAAALAIARRLMKSAGIGHGGIVTKSGELSAMERALAMTGAAEDPVFFDIGANIGDWTRAAKAKWPKAQVHAFEPSARHLELLRPAVQSLAGVKVTGAALGREAGQATLYKDQEVTGLASMTRRDLSHIGIDMASSETIEVTTLDAYCAANGIAAIDYLKIDVEGHELDVLAGAAGMLERRAISAVQFEFGGCNIDTRTFLRDFFMLFSRHGYGLFICAPGGRLVPVKRYRETIEQFATTNYLAVRQ